MSQQINLFNPLFLAQKKVFSALKMAEALGVLLAGCVLLGLYGQHNSANLQQAATSGAAQLAQKQARLDKISVDYAPRAHDKALDAELAQLEARAVLLRSAEHAIEHDELGNKAGYAPAFKALARQSVDGLWLTGVTIENNAARIALEGRALDAALVPAYLGRLGRESVLQGKRFDSLRIGQQKAVAETGNERAPFVEFSVAAAGEGKP
ncbi:MAG: PilN domain-containing protein [Massilia sp.]